MSWMRKTKLQQNVIETQAGLILFLGSQCSLLSNKKVGCYGLWSLCLVLSTIILNVLNLGELVSETVVPQAAIFVNSDTCKDENVVHFLERIKENIV